MKIETLFRGKRFFHEEWIEGNLIQSSAGEKYIIPFKDIEEDGHHLIINSDGPVFVIPETIGEFSGITDLQDHKIFENDLRITDDGIIFRIYRVTGGFVIKDSVWMRDTSDLIIGDDLIFAHLTDAQTVSWLLSGTKHYAKPLGELELIK